MLVLLLACFGGPTDSGFGPPVWSGTQIGEEGDDCPVNAFESGETHQEERAALTVSKSGTFVSAFQGSVPMTLDIDPSGVAWDILDCEQVQYEGVDSDVRIEAEGLLLIDSIVRMSTHAGHVFTVVDVDGDLSPGELPEDAGQLVLELPLFAPDYEGEARWLLERPGGWEWAPAGSWTLD